MNRNKHTINPGARSAGTELGGQTGQIRILNDQLRRNPSLGKVVLTRGIAALPSAQISRLIGAVAAFDDLDDGNDPWGDHDFGAIKQDGETYFWKIDYYDLDLQYASPDPSDPLVTTRVITVMTSDEY